MKVNMYSVGGFIVGMLSFAAIIYFSSFKDVNKDKVENKETSDYIHPEDFGAVGDGSHDDTKALQDAINAASAQGGGNVLLKKGKKYMISSSIIMLKGVWLGSIGGHFNMESFRYESGLPVILPQNGFTGAALEFDSLSNGAFLQGVMIDCTNQSSGDGIDFLPPAVERRTNSTIEQCLILNAKGDGINIPEHSLDLVLKEDCVYNCTGNGLDINGLDHHIMFCYFGNSGQNGILAKGAALRFTDCDSWGNKLNGLSDEGFQNRYYNLQTDRNGQNGIFLNTSSPVYKFNRKQIQFIGCKSLKNNMSSGQFTDLQIDDVSDCSFTGCLWGQVDVMQDANAGYGKKNYVIKQNFSGGRPNHPNQFVGCIYNGDAQN